MSQTQTLLDEIEDIQDEIADVLISLGPCNKFSPLHRLDLSCAICAHTLDEHPGQ